MADDRSPFEEFVRPLEEAAEDEYQRALLLNLAGFDSGVLAENISASVSSVSSIVTELTAYVDAPPEDLDGFLQAIEKVDQLFSAIEQISSDVQTAELPSEVDPEEVVQALIDYLVVRYLQANHPFLTNLAVLLQILRPGEIEANPSSEGFGLSRTTRLPEFDFERISELFRDPVGTVRDEYVPADTSDADGVREALERVFPPFMGLVQSLGATVQGQVIRPASSVPSHPVFGEPVGVVSVVFSTGTDSFLLLHCTVFVDTMGDYTLAVAPVGDTTLAAASGRWAFGIGLNAEVNEIAISADEVTFDDGNADMARLGVGLSLARLPDPESGRSWTIGGQTGTRLEIGQFSVEGETDLRPSSQRYGLAARATDSRFILSPGEGDGFLQEILPADGISGEFDLGIGWTNERGVYLEGGGALEAKIAIHESIGDVISLETLTIGADFANSEMGGEIPVSVAISVGTTLGPIQAVVEDIGLRASLSFPDGHSGNLGPIDADLGFKPPEGVGLSVDGGVVVGGGYLKFDPDKEQYAGVLDLQFGTISVKAIGLLTTRLPDGSSGFSLLLIISGEFTPLQLGFGFTLNAVGGLLGVNRMSRPEVIREGIKGGTIRSVMFPEDPIRNAPQIVSDLRRIFPPANGQFIVGPMARLGWGTPTLITADLGILLELPAPVRLMVLGRLSAVLPDEEAPLLELNMNALGVVNFDEQRASVDAALYDSYVTVYTLTGGMAMRVAWGEEPEFGLSVGGFHPKYPVPAEFADATLDRVGFSLGAVLRIGGYFAVTSNTAQVGARADLRASAYGFSIVGHLGFDALFEFDPFRFIVDVGAGIALKRGSATIFSIQLSGSLAGPSPWHLNGRAKFKIWPITFKIRIDEKFGSSHTPSAIPPADVFGQVMSALSEERNWTAQLSRTTSSFVSLREIANDQGDVLLHPLGTLGVRQQVVPLGVQIDRFGNARPERFTRFEIVSVSTATVPSTGPAETITLDGGALREKFAPAQYLDLSETEKLSRPAFEDYSAGWVGRMPDDDWLAFAGKGVEDSSLVTSATLSYENKTIDNEIVVSEPDATTRTAVPVATAVALSRAGSVATGLLRETGQRKFAGPHQRITVGEVSYVVVRRRDMTRVFLEDVPMEGTTYVEAEQAMKTHIDRHPEMAGALLIVASHETNGGDDQ